MSDRRSFSEIPAEILRDHGSLSQVERGWARLESELVEVPSKRGSRVGPAIALAAVTFASGIWVGARYVNADAVPRALVTSEPERRAVMAPAGTPVAVPENTAVARVKERAPLARRDAPTRRVEVPEEPSPAPAPVTSTAVPFVRWQKLADDGQYAEALAVLEAGDGFDSMLRQANADELMSLVDVARATGQRERALVALRRIVAEHGADPNAPVAAWMLGNELAKAGDFGGAEQAFAMYRALSPNGDFAEDALARQIDMAADQGHVDHARKLAEKYLKEFSDGPRSAEIRTQLEGWSKERAPAMGSASAEAAAQAEVPPAVVGDAGPPG